MVLQKKNPEFIQFLNRLIEYVDSDHIIEAAKKFLFLVDSGMEPNHAFKVVISDRFMCGIL